MKRASAARRPFPRSDRKPSTAVPSPRVSTVSPELPPPRPKSPRPAARVVAPQPILRPPKTSAPARRRVAHIVGEDESTLLDLIDNLLGKGVVLNAEVILALANVDLVYVRLSALLCAADRVLPQLSRRSRDRGEGAGRVG